METDYKLLNKVKIPVVTEKEGVTLKGERVGTIDEMRASLWIGDYYSSGHTIEYRVVNNTYDQKDPVWVTSEEIIELIEQ